MILKTKNKLTILIAAASVIFVSLASIGVGAQEKPLTSKLIKKNQLQKRPQVKAFDPAMLAGDYLSDDFYAYDIKDVVAVLVKISSLPKDQYESSEEHKLRVDAIFKKTKILGAAVGEVVAIQTAVTSEVLPFEGVKFTFNADKEHLDFHVLAKKKSLAGYVPRFEASGPFGEHDNVIDLERRVDRESEYVGSNAMGVKAKIRSYRMSQFGMVANEIDWLPYTRKSAYVFDIPVSSRMDYSRNLARQTLNNLRAVLVMKIGFPYLIAGTDFKTATMDSTYENIVTTRYLTGELMGVVFFDGKTHEIIHRLPENFGKQ